MTTNDSRSESIKSKMNRCSNHFCGIRMQLQQIQVVSLGPSGGPRVDTPATKKTELLRPLRYQRHWAVHPKKPNQPNPPTQGHHPRGTTQGHHPRAPRYQSTAPALGGALPSATSCRTPVPRAAPRSARAPRRRGWPSLPARPRRCRRGSSGSPGLDGCGDLILRGR